MRHRGAVPDGDDKYCLLDQASTADGKVRASQIYRLSPQRPVRPMHSALRRCRLKGINVGVGAGLVSLLETAEIGRGTLILQLAPHPPTALPAARCPSDSASQSYSLPNPGRTSTGGA